MRKQSRDLVPWDTKPVRGHGHDEGKDGDGPVSRLLQWLSQPDADAHQRNMDLYNSLDDIAYDPVNQSSTLATILETSKDSELLLEATDERNVTDLSLDSLDDLGEEIPASIPVDHVQAPKELQPRTSGPMLGRPREMLQPKISSRGFPYLPPPTASPPSRSLEFVPTPSCSSSCMAKPNRNFQQEEEREWAERKARSGTVGRLVVYRDSDQPQNDIYLRGGGSSHVVVAAVREGGMAAKANVKAGDRLVSIDGKKDFVGKAAEAIHQSLMPPTILVFCGFVGKPTAEVRLNCSVQSCGISTKKPIKAMRPDEGFFICEQRVFQAGTAPIFLSVEGHKEKDMNQVFELRQSDAHQVVRQAMLKSPSLPNLATSKMLIPPLVGLEQMRPRYDDLVKETASSGVFITDGMAFSESL